MAKKVNPPAVRGEFPKELTEWVLAADGEEITEELERALDRVLKDRKKRSQVFLTALARKRIERLMYLMKQLPIVEKELFSKNRIKVASTGELIRLLAAIGVDIQSTSEFLRVFVSDDELKTEPPPKPGPKTVEAQVVTSEEKDAAREITVEGRQRLRRLFQKALAAVSYVDEEKKEKQLPEPKK